MDPTKRWPCVLVIGLAVAHAAVGLAGPLGDALEMIPGGLTDTVVFFTDWAGIKRELDLEWVTSDSAEAFRLEIGLRTMEDHAAASGFALERLRDHAEDWGWDTADLAWEANVISRELPPAYVLKLRDGFDFAPVAARFVERGFVQTASYGAWIFTHDIDTSADWIRTTELSIHATAHLEEEQLLVLASYPGAVEAFLATRAGQIPSMRGAPGVIACAQALADPLAAMLQSGIGTCLGYTSNPVQDLLGTAPDDAAIEALRNRLEDGSALLPYQALAVGYRTVEDEPLGTIAFGYVSAEAAAADLEPRRMIAEHGMSSTYDLPTSETFFTVLDAYAEDRVLILSVDPAHGQPRRLFQMLLYRDAPFAGCS